MESQPLVDRRAPAWPLRLQNIAAATGVVVFALTFHRIAEQNRSLLARRFGWDAFWFTGEQFIVVAASFYVVLLAVFFLFEREPGISKSLRFWQLSWSFACSPVAAWRAGLSQPDRVAVLATLLKALFGPLMTMALMTASMSMVANSVALLRAGFSIYTFRELFDRHLYWFLFQLIVMADVFVFTFGYLVELPRLRNQIRSVDPSLIGWAAALVCYTPFNIVVGSLLGNPGSEFPRFGNATLHYVLNFLLLALMAVYTSASVALGFKASNLTHRGIVTHGPYRFVRHPAYVCKNMAWWIGSIPVISAAFDQSILNGLQALAAVIGWAALYVLRAVTEEDHLRSVDGEYAAYAATVRYRFIPGVV